ncbi:hypothetical protein ACIRF8_33080 [Streptomyces sp. NPDC102406]|uniref:hypothetical protein n=1 Tax=Streptomyces sp. NPDC102406 TaxID=3366171 RepID=UPI0037FAA3B5
MRPPEDHSGSRSTTPIYDALYAEYRRSFRTLPGDRSGEEDMGFVGFGTGSYAARHHTPYYSTGQHHYAQTNGRHPGQGGHSPAALPPAPRRDH